MQSQRRWVASAILTLALFGTGFADVTRSNGLQSVHFKTSQGAVKVFLPDNLTAGDTISGIVLAEAKNADKASDEIQGYVIEIGGQKTAVSGGAYKWIVPAGALALILKDSRGHTVARETVQVQQGLGQPVTQATDTIDPCQAGKPFSIPGPNDPSQPSQITVNGQQTMVLCESPNSVVAIAPADLKGPATIQITENGQTREVKTCVFQLTLKASKTTLMQGEHTTLHVSIDFPGASSPTRLTLTNLTPSVVRFTESDGTTLIKTITPEMLDTNGHADLTVPLTALATGGFAISSKVDPNGCDHTKTVTLIEALRKGKDNEGYFVEWNEVDWEGTCSLRKKDHGGAHRYSWKKGDAKPVGKKEHFATKEDRDKKYSDMETERKEREASKDSDK